MKTFIMDPATQQVSMEQVRQLKTLLNGTINDVLLALTTSALRQQTLAGKQELAAFGKITYGQRLEYMPPPIYKTMKKREYRTRAADHREQKGVVNLTVSNVPGPRSR